MWKAVLNRKHRSHHLHNRRNLMFLLWRSRLASPVELQDILLETAKILLTFHLAIDIRKVLQRMWIVSRLKMLQHLKLWLRLHIRKLVLIMIGICQKTWSAKVNRKHFVHSSKNKQNTFSKNLNRFHQKSSNLNHKNFWQHRSNAKSERKLDSHLHKPPSSKLIWVPISH